MSLSPANDSAALAAKIRAASPDATVTVQKLDLTSLEDIRAAAAKMKAAGARVLGDGEPKIGAHGKPVLFLSPDLERYRAERGLYLDYEAEVPGPILTNPAELASALDRIDEISKTYAPKYRAWQKRFNALEDGHAANRVVDAVWGA